MNIIIDSNIVIHSIKGGVFDELFEVAHELFFAKPLIVELEKDADRFKKKVINGSVKIINWNRDIRRKANSLGRKHSDKLLREDLILLATVILSEEKIERLATSDYPLRNAAHLEHVDLLWIGDFLKFIGTSEGEALELLRKIFPQGVPAFSCDVWPFAISLEKEDSVSP